jgi:hypothetical protein
MLQPQVSVMQMKNKLLALATTLSALAAGVYFVNFDSGAVDPQLENFGAFETYDKSQCVTSACNTIQCQQALDILADAGSSCTPRFAECPIRVSQRIRNIGADAGFNFGPEKYQNIKLIALKCGARFGVPVEANGWPTFAVASGTPGCVYKPQGGACTRLDGGDPGVDNQYPVGQLTGAGCLSVTCGCIAGDCP